MQRTALLSIVFVAACGGGGEATPVHVATATATASATPEPPPAPLGIPRDAPFVATFDISAVSSVFGTLRGELEHDLRLPEGALTGDLADLGVDTKRPVAFVVAPVGHDAAALVHDLRGAPASALDTARRVQAIPLLFGFRVLLPASDSHRLVSKVRELLTQAGWHPRGAGFVAPHQALGISSDGAWVALDMAAAMGATADLAALEHLLAGPIDAPALERGALHATWSPQAFAPVPFLTGMVQVLGAISGESVRLDQKERIFAVGLKEASGTFALAEENGKPIFDRVDLTASAAPFAVTVRAKPSAGVALPPSGDWFPSTALLFPGARADLSSTVALMDAWPFPRHPFVLARDGGLFAYLVGLPEVFAEAPRDIGALMHEAAPPEDVARRFERVGESWNMNGDEIWYGVLPQKTTRAEAQCSLAVGPCAGATKLPVGKTTKAGHGFAKVVEIDHRWVLLLAKDAPQLDVKPTATTASPLHLEVDAKGLGELLHASAPLPARVVGDVSHDADGSFLFRFVAPR